MARLGRAPRVHELADGGVGSQHPEQYDDEALQALFPNLGPDTYQIAAGYDPSYNCVAWASGETDSVWTPPMARGTDRIAVEATFWPRRAPAEWTVTNVAQVFRLQGYVDGDLEDDPDVERIAIYARGDEPTHVAWRGDRSAVWASKLGRNVAIVHRDLAGLEGGEFGAVVKVMHRKPGTSDWPSPSLPAGFRPDIAP